MINFLKGIVIGIANIIPGVSGGTMAVILGIYENLIQAISNFFTDKKNRKKYLILIIQVGLGAVLGVFILAKAMEFLLTNYPQNTFFFFIGLIIGGIPIIYKAHSNMKPSIVKIIVFLFFFSLIFLISNLSAVNIDQSTNSIFYLYLLISGFFAAGAMIVPGISGSFLLLVLGTYNTIIQAISSFNFLILGTVALGAILGILIFTKIINILLKKCPSHTYYGILGLIFGSILIIWPGLSLNLSGALSILFCVLGIFIINKFH
jgi:putative membrane protein